MVLLTLCITLLSSTSLVAGGRRRPAAASPSPAGDSAITFVELTAPGEGSALLDAGTLQYGARERRTVKRTQFGIRIGRPSREARGTATLRAFLETAGERAIVRIDGVVLDTTPRVIDRQAPVGLTARHRLEIEVPADAPEGAMNLSIGWEVTTND